MMKYYQILRFTIYKIRMSRQRSSVIGIDKQNNGTDQSPETDPQI